jgi:hypothetical protein
MTARRPDSGPRCWLLWVAAGTGVGARQQTKGLLHGKQQGLEAGAEGGGGGGQTSSVEDVAAFPHIPASQHHAPPIV